MQITVYLRDVGATNPSDGEWDECWVVCSKGDPGAVEFEPADQRCDRAEFALAILAACFMNRIGEVHALLWPGPVESPDGKMYDGTDKVKAVRHDMIRKLFHQ